MSFLALLALAATFFLVARAVSSVLYVRSRIRLDRGRPYDRARTIAAHFAALAAICALVAGGLLPRLAVLPFAVLLTRAALGLSARRRPMSVRTIGRTELAYAILTVLAVVVGFW